MVKGIPFLISPDSRYIISTSGRPTSLDRYQQLLQDKLGLDIVYLPIQPYRSDGKIFPEDFTGAIRGLGAIGGAISKDIKAKVLPHLDRLDPLAEKIQSVNTVLFENGELVGYNTDAIGFEKAIIQGVEESRAHVKSAVVYGYGGVFNVAYQVLQNLGIQVFVTGRDQRKVDEVNVKFGLEAFLGEADLFVNATPVTDEPLENAQGFLEALEGAKMVFDHHMPGEELKRYCVENNKFYIPGTAMYLPQMVEQWSLFLKDFINTEKVENALKSLQVVS